MRMVKQSAGVLLDERQTVRGQRTPTINAGGASWGGGALALLEIGREHGLEHLGACAKDHSLAWPLVAACILPRWANKRREHQALVQWHLEVVN